MQTNYFRGLISLALLLGGLSAAAQQEEIPVTLSQALGRHQPVHELVINNQNELDLFRTQYRKLPQQVFRVTINTPLTLAQVSALYTALERVQAEQLCIMPAGTDTLIRLPGNIRWLQLKGPELSRLSSLHFSGEHIPEGISIVSGSADLFNHLPHCPREMDYLELITDISESESEELIFLGFTHGDGQPSADVYLSPRLLLPDSAHALARLEQQFGQLRKPEHHGLSGIPDEHAGSHPFVHPVIRSAEKKFERWELFTDQALFIRSAEGTILRIPAKAFVYPNGTVVNGPVEVQYRQWTGMGDMLWSGLPLLNANGGDTSLFRTAGMFEINAYANNEKLRLVPGKEITVFFPDPLPQEEFNFYQLNDTTGKWDDLGRVDSNTVNTNNLLRTPPPTVKVKKRKIPAPPDRTLFATRYANPDYVNLMDSGKTKQSVYVPTAFSKRRQKVSQSNYLPSRRNSRHIKLELEKMEVNDTTIVHFFTVSMPDNAVPEARFIMQRRWKLPEGMAPKQFTRRYIRGKRYHDMRLEYDGGDDFTIELKSRKGLDHITTSIRTGRTTGVKPVHRRIFGRAMTKYESKLNMRAKFFNKYITERYSRYVQDNLPSFLNYSYSALQIPNLGLYNCDQEYRMENPQQILASYSDMNETPLYITRVMVIDPVARGVFNYYSRGSFAFSPSGTAAVVFMSGEAPYYLLKEDIQTLRTSEKIQNLRLRKFDGSLEEFAKMITQQL